VKIVNIASSNHEGTNKIKLALEQSAISLDSTIAARLAEARRKALDRQKPVVAELSLATSLANMGVSIGNNLLPRARMLMAIVGLTLGIVSTYYWNAFEQADENVGLDSALLADELPVAAYTDQGFDAWLEHSSQASEL
jgi:predicted chitinase